MPGPYNPPNPYGSYFSFADVQGAAVDSFMPFSSGGFSPGTQAMMGRSTGGFNPTSQEYIINRMHNESMARFMADVYKGDPRTASFSNLVLQAAYGADSKRRQATVERLGGMGNIQELVGFAMSQPGISGYMGGGPASLGMGAYAAASSGFGINGRTMAGDGPLVQQMAKALYGHVQRQFYTPAGAAMPGMTQGLNRDQLGGLMSIMSSQGAFREINLGQVGAGSDGRAQLNVNATGLRQFTDTIKNAAKALGSIMDVYGDASVSELFSKAQQITGLNFANPRNAALMSQRITQLRQTGEMFGYDAQTMFDASKMGVAMGQSLGLTGHMAAYAGTYSAERAALLSRAVSSGRTTEAGGFIPSMQELQAGSVRDIAGMAFDPIGSRRGLVSMILRRGGVSDPGSNRQIQEMMTNAGVGGMNENQIDSVMRKFGFDLPTMIRQFGGPAGIMKNLSGEQAEMVTQQNADDMRRRAEHRLRTNFLQPTFGRATNAAALLTSTFEPQTIQDLMKASGSATEMNNVLQRSVEARRDPDRYKQAVSAVLAAGGGDANRVAAQFGMVDMMARTDPLTAAHTSAQARDSAARMADSKIPMLSGEDRGFTKMGFLDGVLNRYGGTDMRSTFARIMTNTPGLVSGGFMGLSMPAFDSAFDTKRMSQLVTSFQREFSKNQAGRDLLQEMGLVDPTGKNRMVQDIDQRKMFDILTSPSQRALLFRNFQEMRYQDSAGQVRSTFVPKTHMQSMQQFGGLIDVAKMVVNKNAASGTQADYLLATGLALADPDFTVRQVRDKHIGGALRRLSPEEAQDQMSNMLRQTTTLDVLQKLGASAVKDLGRMNNQWGQTAMSVLEDQEKQLMLHPEQEGAAKKRAFVKEAREALAGAGIASGGNMNMVLSGSLRLGDQELEIVNGAIKQGKK